jgi:uncharacterized membrane protein YcaP (DUF421 family)
MHIDWAHVLLPDTAPIEIFVRGTLVYLSMFFLLRVVLKRQTGAVSVSDLLVVVLIADAAQNGMAGTYQSVADGLLLVATIVFWSYALDWLAYHFTWFAPLMHPKPLLLVKNGKLQREHMRRELITYDELMSALHQSGLDDLHQVREAFIEGDGRISIIGHEGHPPPSPKAMG